MHKIIKIAIHAIYWIVYISYSIASGQQMAHNLNITILWPHLLINLIWAGVAFYSFYFYVIKFFAKNRYVNYLLISLAICLICAIVFIPVHFLINSSFSWLNIQLAIASTIGTFIIGQCGSLVRGFENWIDSIRNQAEIETRQLRAENELLKSQISPHFLFNTLNNIDSFIFSEPQKASETLISLSDMLRYMIYETKVEKVLFAKELDYITNYINLQKIRINNAKAVVFSVKGNYDDVFVAPLIFLPFIENAFKHVSNREEDGAIKIDFDIENNKLKFKCINNFDEKIDDKNTGGFGLENVKRRLDLMYKNKYELTINKTISIFDVGLLIDL
jgi:two-component system, LytTR family, sensor kinase